MKKSMRFVSVIMAAVMSMSAMSALAAGASAEEVNEPGQGYVLDEMHNRSTLPVFIETTGINSKLKSYSITMDYEFLVLPMDYGHDHQDDHAAVMRIIRDAYPDAVSISTPDKNGFVLVKAHKTYIFSENTNADTTGYIELPRFVDMNSLKIRLDYNSTTMGEREICKFNFASLNLNDPKYCDQISIHLDHDRYSSIITGNIIVNGNLVCSRKV